MWLTVSRGFGGSVRGREHHGDFGGTLFISSVSPAHGNHPSALDLSFCARPASRSMMSAELSLLSTVTRSRLFSWLHSIPPGIRAPFSSSTHPRIRTLLPFLDGSGCCCSGVDDSARCHSFPLHAPESGVAERSCGSLCYGFFFLIHIYT